jgi:hypothetical protein
MSGTAQVTDASAFEQKSPGIQVALAIVTLGLYTLYWLYSTAKQLDEGTGESLTPILAIIPVVNLISIWQVSNAAEAVTDQSKIIMFVLFLVFAPISWYWIQSGINEAAAR